MNQLGNCYYSGIVPLSQQTAACHNNFLSVASLITIIIVYTYAMAFRR